MTRGYSLNNPFNLEIDGIDWQGMITPSSDNVFCQFEDAVHGIRAGLIDLKNQLKEGFDTITKLITKYAPPSENDTAAYIKNVSERTGIDPNKVLQQSDLKQLAEAIIIQEQGSFIYSDDIMNQALILAGINT